MPTIWPHSSFAGPKSNRCAVGDGEPAGILTACGFGPNGAFRCVQGGITGHPTAVGATYPSTTIVGAVRPGDSGGGVLNTRGQVVGVVWGQRDGQTYATCGRPVREFLNRIRGKVFARSKRPKQRADRQPPVSSPQSPTRLASLHQRTRRPHPRLDAKKQDKGDYLQHGDLNGYLRTEEAAKLTGPLGTADGSGKQTERACPRGSNRCIPSSNRCGKASSKSPATAQGSFEGVSIGKVAVGALGLSGPLAAAVIVAGGLVGRRRSRAPLRVAAKRSGRDARRTRTLRARPIAVDSPPPPQRTVPETHYVPVEKDSFAKAHQWASEHVARKYPGATEVLQAQDSLIKQFLAGK